MGKSVELKPVGVIKARLGIEPNGRVQRKFQNLCYQYMDKYVPRRDGNLRREVDLSNPTQIVYEMPYAHAQYVGFTKGPVNPANYTTPGTGPYWDERMKSAEMDSLVKDLQKFVDRGGK